MLLLKPILFIGCFLLVITASISQEVSEEVIEIREFNQLDTRRLDLVSRTSDALTGTQVIQNVINLNIEERENYFFNEIKKGNIPDFLRNMVKVSNKIAINGTYRSISYYVLPDYVAIGSDEDYFLCPMTPVLGQKIADALDCFLPTKKMVDQIWEASKVKMEPQPIPPSDKMTTVPVFKQHNDMVVAQRQSSIIRDTLGSLVSGNKKDVIISNLIYSAPAPRSVIIYGWHDSSGKNIQPIYAGHSEDYVDYSHGIRLIHNKVYVDGVEILVSDVLKSNELHSLLSDEGIIYKPYYPY